MFKTSNQGCHAADPTCLHLLEEMHDSKRAYKRGIREGKSKRGEVVSRRLAARWASSNRSDFWKEWNRKSGISKRKQIPPAVLPAFERQCELDFEPNSPENARLMKDELTQ